MDKLNFLARVLIGAIALIYFVSPDPIPGPIDDIVLLALSYKFNNKLKLSSNDTKYIND